MSQNIYCNNCKKNIGVVKIGRIEFEPIKNRKGHTERLYPVFVEDEKGDRIEYLQENGVLSARKRLDGHWGFQCVCGNNSLLAEEERGKIKAEQPKQHVLDVIRQKVAEKPTKTRKVKGMLEVDNFRRG